MTINYLEATNELNYMLEGTEYEEKLSFYYATNGCTEAITLCFHDFGGEVVVWNSEDDECMYDYGEDGDYPDSYFFTWVINKLKGLGNDVIFMSLDLWDSHNNNK